MLTINLDADGCLYDYSGRFWAMAEDYYGRKFPPSTEWGQHQVMGISEDEYWDFFHYCAVNGVFRDGDAIPGGIESIKQWYKEGHRLRVITHKSLRKEDSTYHAQSDMIHWLYSQEVLNKVEVIFPKGQYHKQGFPADITVDDKPDLLWAQAGGTVNILYDQPWNAAEEVLPIEAILEPPTTRRHSHTDAPLIYRARGWDEVRAIVAKVVERRKNEVLYH